MVKAGSGSVDITPPLGCGLQGYFLPRTSEKIHDPLSANAIVVENGNQRICLVSCDIISMRKDVADKALKLIREKTGIPESSVIICGTHTHTGPAIQKSRLPGWENAIDEKWMGLLPFYISSAAVHAANSMQEAGVSCMSGFENRVSFNRRFIMKDGTIKTNPGVGNPDILEPAGPVDPEVGVVALGSSFSEINSLAVNFTLHLDTIGGNNISADFPGVMRSVIRRILGENTGIVYTSGAMGNINHIDVKRESKRKPEYFESAERIGRILGGEVVKTLSRMEKFDRDLKVGGEKTTVKLGLKEYDGESVKRAMKAVSETKSGLHNMEYLSGLAILRASSLGEKEVDADVAAIRMGDTAFVSIPGEYFVELGIYIKENSPFDRTFIVELGLDSLGYIAPKEAYGQEGYEPVSSPLAPGAGEVLAETAVKLLKSLKQ